MTKQRLQKVLASAGVASRRRSEELILEGQVRVNSQVVENIPFFVDPEKDKITVFGRRIQPQQKVYYILNKPKNVICTSSDPQGRRTALDLIGAKQRLFCIGRLDIETTGAIIITNDCELANKLTHPRFEIAKTYLARVRGRVSTEDVDKLRKGIHLAERKTAAAMIKVLRQGHTESLIQITLHQGINRQVRRMFAKINHKVLSLKRTHIGKISVHGLGIGRYRQLTKSEVAYLQKITKKASAI
ncbi:MAG: pseudouridine synthase [Planctomycetota bacterium]